VGYSWCRIIVDKFQKVSLISLVITIVILFSHAWLSQKSNAQTDHLNCMMWMGQLQGKAAHGHTPKLDQEMQQFENECANSSNLYRCTVWSYELDAKLDALLTHRNRGGNDFQNSLAALNEENTEFMAKCLEQ
jgi:hypothetical protein